MPRASKANLRHRGFSGGAEDAASLDECRRATSQSSLSLPQFRRVLETQQKNSRAVAYDHQMPRQDVQGNHGKSIVGLARHSPSPRSTTVPQRTLYAARTSRPTAKSCPGCEIRDVKLAWDIFSRGPCLWPGGLAITRCSPPSKYRRPIAPFSRDAMERPSIATLHARELQH